MRDRKKIIITIKEFECGKDVVLVTQDGRLVFSWVVPPNVGTHDVIPMEYHMDKNKATVKYKYMRMKFEEWEKRYDKMLQVR